MGLTSNLPATRSGSDHTRFSMALAYAWGHNDASRQPIPGGDQAFATAYMTAGREFDEGAPGRGRLHSIGRHYEFWLASNGVTLWEQA